MTRQPWYSHIKWLYCFPNNIIIWIATLIIWSLYGHRLHWNDGLWCELKKDSWPSRTWYKGWGGTTLGHGGFYATGKTKGQGVDTEIEFHEHIHIEQFEAGMLRVFLIAIFIMSVCLLASQPMLGLYIALPLWFAGALITFVPNWLQALIRGEEAYMGSHHEESAYAQTELKKRKGGFI
ncbi:MAG: hypothetical protein DRI98_12360 [Bacteroidetes bacterium]|nr:MAG: hypothetical protein DRI98_12360 [Bacteroidota bacterium]